MNFDIRVRTYQGRTIVKIIHGMKLTKEVFGKSMKDKIKEEKYYTSSKEDAIKRIEEFLSIVSTSKEPF